MNLNRIQLPASIIADLYQHTLVMADKEAEGVILLAGQADAYKFLGRHEKNIAIIFTSTQSLVVPEDQLAFLTRMLEACKLTLADVAILNQNTRPVDITRLKEQLHPTIILLFGLEPKEIKLPFNSPAFKIQEYDNCKYLYVPPIVEITRETEQGKLLKSKLWVCLRSLLDL